MARISSKIHGSHNPQIDIDLQMDMARQAGKNLRTLINMYYTTQEEFAFEYGMDIRSVNRYINEGITKVPTIQELAVFFQVDFVYFFTAHA